MVALANCSQRPDFFRRFTPDPSSARTARSVPAVINRFAESFDVAIIFPPIPDPSIARIARSVPETIERFPAFFHVAIIFPPIPKPI